MKPFSRKSLSAPAAMRDPPVFPDPAGDHARHYPLRRRTEADVAGSADIGDHNLNRRRNRAAQTAETWRTLNSKIDNWHRFSLASDGDPHDGRRDQRVNLMPGFVQADPRVRHPSGRQRMARDPGHIGYAPGNRNPLLRARPGMYRNDCPLPADNPAPVQPQRHRHPAMRRPV